MKQTIKHPEGGSTRVDLRSGVLSIVVLSEIGGVVGELEIPLTVLASLGGAQGRDGVERMVRIPMPPEGQVV